MHIPRTIAALGGVMLSATALVVTPAAHASAASVCIDAGFNAYTTVRENGGINNVYEAYYCYNRGGSPVYRYADSSQIVGYMNSSWSWFLCRNDHGDFNGESGSHASRWLWTQADNGQWGFMSDAYIDSETDPVQEC